MASTAENITCDGFVFFNNFDSANLAKVEQVRILEKAVEKDVYKIEDTSSSNTFNSKDAVDYEFNLWTKHDCHGTQFQNNNRTWFYFGVRSNFPSVSVKFNLVNLNKQVKMFSQGMCPVFKIVPGHLNWERIRERPTYTLDQKGNEFTLSFLYYTPENSKAVTYFAFTYPFSYTDLQNYLKRVDARMGKGSVIFEDDIYYHRECAIKSLEGRRLDVLTISSYHNITQKREDRLNNMFPELSEERPYKFRDKKVIFISARVHPGETPSSFVLNGFLNFLLNREDQIAINLRRLYVFKLIPMLNPDGVARGHYRMDTKGVNLNRVYLHPSQVDHPTIYAARNLIRYYHHSYQLSSELVDDDLSNINLEIIDNNIINSTASLASNYVCDTTTRLLQQVTLMSLDEKNMYTLETNNKHLLEHADSTPIEKNGDLSKRNDKTENIAGDRASDRLNYTTVCSSETPKSSNNSGLYLYIDLHGHASKKGVFMYGNHFTDPEDTVTCMLLPKLMSINNPHFHFTSCNFAERNMYIIDKRDGMSREGSGRVAVYRMTGLIRSYTLECNYNSGRLVNTIPPRVRDKMNKTMNRIFVPPKYTPAVFETVGAALGPSILDLTENNPNSRLPNSQYRSLRGVKSHLKLMYVNNLSTLTNKSMRKDNVDAVAQNTCISKDVETKLNDAMTGARNVIKNENKLMRKSILRRGVSLYSAMKRIKSSKKSRQTRQALRTHSANNVEDNTVICTIKSEVKPFLKTIHYCRSTRSNIESVICSDILEPRLNICTNKKLTATSSSMKAYNIPIEETTAVRHGSKRLKMISSTTMAKNIFPETEESFCFETSTKVSSKITRVHGKQNIKKINNKTRIPAKSSKLKKMNKNSSIFEEDTN